MAVALALVLLLAGIGQKATDSCASVFPSSLRKAVERQFPGHRLPKQDDNGPDDIQYHRTHGGNGCLGADQGDFNRDGRKDVVFLASLGSDVFLMVALAGPKVWEVEKVWTVGESTYRRRLYVEATDPGKYDDLDLADEMEPGQVATFTCDAQVVVTGMTESTGVAFCKTASGWVHAWISD